MLISTRILTGLGACQSGFEAFKAQHGDAEILFSDCVKSKSNSIEDYFWFMRRQTVNADQKKDLQLLAIEFAERVLPIFESECPEDKRPRVALETAKRYLCGEATLDALKEARQEASEPADMEDAAYSAYAAACCSADADVGDLVDSVSSAASAAGHTYDTGSDSAAAERSWQVQRLAELLDQWGW